jgi:hypothetical protein
MYCTGNPYSPTSGETEMTKTYEPIRLEAQKLGIKHWHIKTLEDLEQEVSTRGQEPTPVAYCVPEEALDVLSSRYFAQARQVFDGLVWDARPVLGDSIAMDWMTARIDCSCSKSYAPVALEKFLGAVCEIYKGWGWSVEDGTLNMPNRDRLFTTSWHVRLWDNRHSDRLKTVHKLLEIVSKPLEETDHE